MTERLEDVRIQRFLGTKEVVVLSTLEADGSPLAMPIWFLHGPEFLTMISQADTQKVRNLRRDPRVCVTAESGNRAAMRSVIIRGRAEFLSASAERDTLARALLTKYHPDLERRWKGGVMPPDRVMFRIVPTRVQSWGLPT